jgi:monoamine oxidase
VDAAVFEGQSRVGGRMWTEQVGFGDGLLIEIGGELIDSNHETMFALAQEFGIKLDDRWSFERPEMVRETWHLSGQRVSAETLLEQTVALAETIGAQVDAAEADDDAFEALDQISLADWLDENVPVATYPELHEALRVAFIGEFGLEAEEQSCLNLLYLFGYDREDEFLIFGDSDERWHTHEGNDLFTRKLADAIGATNIRLNHKLVAARGGEQGPYTLIFEVEGGKRDEIVARRIVLALPFSTLRDVDLSQLELSEFKREMIAELGMGTNAKIMGQFSARPWWTELNESGLLTTSEPHVQQGWDSTIGQASAEGKTIGVWTNFLGGRRGAQSGQGSAEERFAEAVQGLERIWPGSQAAWTGQAKRMHWPSFAWSKGSYTCYKPGQWRFWSYEAAPEGDVFFCGEHCSEDFQGWMEGGAESGAIIAQAILDEINTGTSTLRQELKQARRQWSSRARRLRQRRRPTR